MAIPDSVFTLEAAKAHLRVTHSEEDALITAMLDAAVGEIEQATRRAWTDRTVFGDIGQEARVDGAVFYAPLSPAYSAKIQYDPGSGPVDVPTVLGISRGTSIATVASWGDAPTEGVAGTLTWKAKPSGGVVPPEIVGAVMLALGDLYMNREGQIVGTIVAQNAAVRALISAHIVDMHA